MTPMSSNWKKFDKVDINIPRVMFYYIQLAITLIILLMIFRNSFWL